MLIHVKTCYLTLGLVLLGYFRLSCYVRLGQLSTGFIGLGQFWPGYIRLGQVSSFCHDR
jgi:hypothetical protein